MVIRKVKYILASILITLVVGCATAKSDFERTLRYDSIQAYDQFLRRYPNSEFSNEARSRKEELLQIQAEKKRKRVEKDRRMDELIRRLKRGVSTSNVWELLGMPHESSIKHKSFFYNPSGISIPDTSTTTYKYKFGNTIYTLHFKEGALTKAFADFITIPLAD